jgi:hypothetical protein
MPGDVQTTSAGAQIQTIRGMLRQLVEAGTLRNSRSRPLEVHLDHAARPLADNDIPSATEMVSLFLRKVRSLQDKDRLPVTAADMLVTPAEAVMEELQAIERDVTVGTRIAPRHRSGVIHGLPWCQSVSLDDDVLGGPHRRTDLP